MRRVLRVLHLPTDVGGNAWGLARAERRLGLASQVLVKSSSRFGYPADICLRLEKRPKWERLVRVMLEFCRVRRRFDVFHFNFGSSLIDFPSYGMMLWDLPFYPRGKKLVFTYNGCDIRQKYPTLFRTRFSACHQRECYGGICNSGLLDERRRKRLKKVEKVAHHIFALNPDLLYFLPEGSTFLPYSVAFWERILPEKRRVAQERCLKVVHAPSERGVKGTRYILEALKKLKKRYNIHVILVEKLPYSRALQLYRQADLVIDQVLVGWYGAFAVEAMKMAKPVAVYIRKEDLRHIPTQMARDLDEAVIGISLENIEEVLAYYLENPSLLRQKASGALEYVHRWHSPEYVAGLTKAVYES
ncbi:MAG: hypothetical protein D6805_03725 [Planctomycetota bacterium]|nr:MAG: hypothetical protein D6805_03725 [Planctomycetota bacterium]